MWHSGLCDLSVRPCEHFLWARPRAEHPVLAGPEGGDTFYLVFGSGRSRRWQRSGVR